MKGATCGAWTVEERGRIDQDGFTPEYWISDSQGNELNTAANLSELMICIAELLEVEEWRHVPDEEEEE